MQSVSLRPVGELLRQWRQRRRLSQLELACEVGISARHMSFLETGRSLPSREMLIRLAAQLAVPLRERNALMLAAGFAPIYSQQPLSGEALGAARAAIEAMLAGHEPYPALAVDRHWNLLAANPAVYRLTSGVDASLLAPPVNVLRLSLHPAGLAPRIANLAEWRWHLLERLGGQIATTADEKLVDLLRELRSYPQPALAQPQAGPTSAQGAAIVVPLQLCTDAGVLSLISATTVFGTPVDVTLSELALETFFPADDATAELLRRLAAGA
jgi:transcriptional regulator with XRE-family HTH domain